MIHPGKFLREEVFNSTDKALKFIKDYDIDPNKFSNLLQEKITIDRTLANALSKWFFDDEDNFYEIKDLILEMRDK